MAVPADCGASDPLRYATFESETAAPGGAVLTASTPELVPVIVKVSARPSALDSPGVALRRKLPSAVHVWVAMGSIRAAAPQPKGREHQVGLVVVSPTSVAPTNALVLMRTPDWSLVRLVVRTPDPFVVPE